MANVTRRGAPPPQQLQQEPVHLAGLESDEALCGEDGPTVVNVPEAQRKFLISEDLHDATCPACAKLSSVVHYSKGQGVVCGDEKAYQADDDKQVVNCPHCIAWLTRKR